MFPAWGGGTGLECCLGGSCVVIGLDDQTNTSSMWPLTLESGDILKVPWPRLVVLKNGEQREVQRPDQVLWCPLAESSPTLALNFDTHW